MRRLAVALLVGLMSVATQTLARPPGHYVNARFGYSIDFPPTLVRALPESDNSDGRRFLLRRGGSGRAWVWGNFASEDRTLRTEAAALEARCDGGRATYRVLRARMMAVSCPSRGRILYQKTLSNERIMVSFSADYPASERQTWDRIVAQMSGSLRKLCGSAEEGPCGD